MSLQQIGTLLPSLTNDELHTLNSQVCMLIKANSMRAASKFYPGDQVYFIHSRTGVRYDGIVTKVKTMNIQIRTISGSTWNVDGNLLKKKTP
jgi:hypothetical protein